MSPEITDSTRREEAIASLEAEQLLLPLHFSHDEQGIASLFQPEGYMGYDDKPLDLNDKSELIAVIGALMSDSAKVFADVESTLVGVQFSLGFPLNKEEEKYLEKQKNDVIQTRQTMQDISFSAEVIRLLWTDLINTPTPETNISTEKTDKNSPEEPYEPTSDDVMLVVDEILKGWVGEARLIMDYIENHFGKRIPQGNELDGLSPAESAIIGGRNAINRHLNELPERIRGPLVLTGLIVMPTSFATTGNSRSF